MAEHGNLQVFISRSVKFCELHLCLQDYDAVWEFWVPGVLLSGNRIS